MVGVMQTRELLAALLSGNKLDLKRHTREAPIVHDQADALDVLATLKESEMPVALVHDEYGHFEGIVTPADISGGDHRRVPLRSRGGGRT